MEEAVDQSSFNASFGNGEGISENKRVMLNNTDEYEIDTCENDKPKNEVNSSNGSDIKKGVSLQRVSFIL